MKAAKCRQDPKMAYEGWEAHAGLVEYLVSSFGNERTKFFLRDANVHAFSKRRPNNLSRCLVSSSNLYRH
jgi:hypothetical protein